jgi:hypothetical protein
LTTGQRAPSSACSFGSSGYDSAKSPTFKAINNKNFNITYGNGNHVEGKVGRETISVGGMSVKSQEFGVVIKASYQGDSVSSGVMGLAFPNLTFVFDGADPAKDNRSLNQAPYDPIFFTAVKEHLVKNPLFSIALNRSTPSSNTTLDINSGLLSFGAVAPIPVTNTTVTVPVQDFANVSTFLLYWNINIDSYNFPNSSNFELSGSGKQAIVDSGTGVTKLPTNISQAVNDAFRPPATLIEELGLYIVNCNATAPDFSVTIGGVKFPVGPQDLIVPTGIVDGTAICASGIQPGGDAVPGALFILGANFLNTVIATLNIRDKTVTLTERQPY